MLYDWLKIGKAGLVWGWFRVGLEFVVGRCCLLACASGWFWVGLGFV